jgi:hypothetical protein
VVVPLEADVLVVAGLAVAGVEVVTVAGAVSGVEVVTPPPPLAIATKAVDARIKVSNFFIDIELPKKVKTYKTWILS